MVSPDRILGSLLGLALGDACGAPYEGGLLEHALWGMIGKTGGKHRWTDDTQMTIDVAECLIAQGQIDQRDLAQRFAKSYHWSRGYGPSTARVLQRIRRGQPWETARTSVYPAGSYGNGGAMRAPVVGLFYAGQPDALPRAARMQAEITHVHPLGLEGAQLIAQATALAALDTEPSLILDKLAQQATAPEFASKLGLAAAWLKTQRSISPQQVTHELGNGIAAAESCVTAIYLALAFRGELFEKLLAFAIRLGGDVDTIAALAGAIWGAARGAGTLPESLLAQLEQRERLAALAYALATAARSHSLDPG